MRYCKRFEYYLEQMRVGDIMHRDGKRIEGEARFAVTLSVIPVKFPAASWQGRFEIDEETFKELLVKAQKNGTITHMNSLDVRNVEVVETLYDGDIK